MRVHNNYYVYRNSGFIPLSFSHRFHLMFVILLRKHNRLTFCRNQNICNNVQNVYTHLSISTCGSYIAGIYPRGALFYLYIYINVFTVVQCALMQHANAPNDDLLRIITQCNNNVHYNSYNISVKEEVPTYYYYINISIKLSQPQDLSVISQVKSYAKRGGMK